MTMAVAEIKYGHISLLKLMPPASIAMISVLAAILEVKKITVKNTNIGLNMLMKYGMKLA